VNFELSTPRFQACLIAARAMPERPALLQFMHCWIAGVGLKNLVKYLLCKFRVAVHLSHSMATVKRGIIVEYGSKLQHHELYTYVIIVAIMQVMSHCLIVQPE